MAVKPDSEATPVSEQVARRSAKALREVVNSIPANVWSAAADGTVDFINERWRELTGLPSQRAMGWNWEAVVHLEDRTRFAAAWRAALQSGQPMESEVRVRTADGTYRWLFVRNVPMRDDQGNIVRWYGTGVDIEDRKRAEGVLAGEKRILEMVAKGDPLRQILEGLCRLVEENATGVLASILLLEGNCLRHGAAPSLPKAYTDAIDGATIGPVAGSCGTAAYFGKQIIVEDIATDPLWADYRSLALPHSLRACWSTPVISSQGKVMATFAMYYREARSPGAGDREIIEQITHLAGIAIERNLTQDRLRRSESYLAEAQRLTQTGSWAFYPGSGKAAYWSEEMFRIWGFDRLQGMPDAPTAWQRIHPEDLGRMKERLESVLRGEIKSDFLEEHRIVLPDGAVKHIEAIGHAVLGPSGEVVEYVGTCVDVTERKRAAEERDRLHHLQAQLAHVNRLTTMGELTASLAHEINQPITAAAANASACVLWLARENPELEEARAAAGRIVEDAKRAAEIVSRTRLLFKKGAAQREPVDVNEVVEQMVTLLRNEAARYGVSIRTELGTELPPVPGDRVQLQQVLMNLMMNGIDAMKSSDGSRELTLTTARDDVDQLMVAVRDTGAGLPEQVDRIFDAFFTTKPHGTGMGLAISRTIVEAHGGRLSAAPNDGRGAVFQFTLPMT
jgi:PAS domain S-box-containing protein